MRSLILIVVILFCGVVSATEYINTASTLNFVYSNEGTGEVCDIYSVEDDIFADTDERKDWRKNKSASWYSELGEFPEKVAIFGGDSLKIYDIQSLSSPYMTFNRSSSNYMISDSTSALKPFGVIEFHNGILYITTADGMRIIDFINDRCYKVNSTAWYIGNKRISDRNKAISFVKMSGFTAIASNTINDIKANTVSAVDYLLIASSGGLNQVTMSGDNFGTVYKVSDTATNSGAYACELATGGEIYFSAQDSATSDEYGYLVTKSAVLSANITDYSDAGLVRYGYDGSTVVNVPLDTALTSIFSIGLLENQSMAESGKDAVLMGSSNEIMRLDINVTTDTKSYLSKMSTLYNREPLLGSTFSIFSGLNSSDDEADLSYRNNDLTAVGTLSASGATTNPNYYAVDFDGLTNALTIESEDFTLTDEVFLSAWIKPDDGQPATNEVIAGVYDVDTTTNTQYAIILETTGRVYAYCMDDADASVTSESEVIFSDGAVSDWYHVALAFKQNDKLYLYVNGELVDSDSVADQTLKTSTTAEFQVGSGFDSASNENQFDGKIASVQLLQELPTSHALYAKALYEHGKNSLGRSSILGGSSTVVGDITFMNNDVLISTGSKFQSVSKELNNYFTGIDFTTNSDNMIVGNKSDYIYIKDNDSSNLSGKFSRGSFNLQKNILEK